MARGSVVQTWSEQVIVEVCCNCGMPFGMSSTFQRERKRDGESFYCPAGHRQFYTGKQDREKELAAQLAKEKREREWAEARAARIRQEKEATDRSLAATKGVVTKMKKRSGHGVCPVQGCKRHFKDLDNHMKTQHPDFAESDS